MMINFLLNWVEHEITSWLHSKMESNTWGGKLLKNLEFINTQDCCDYIQFIYLLIFSGKNRK